MDALFRLAGTKRHDPAIDIWLDRQADGLASIARAWFRQIRECGADVHEAMHDGRPTACVEDAAFAYVDVYRTHVNVGFFFGAELEDPAGLLEGRGQRMRHVKVRPDAVLNGPALGDLIDVAYADIRWRLGKTCAEDG